MPIKRLIRRPEVLKKTGLGRTTLYLLEKAGQFPQHFMLTPRCAAWDEIEIEVWMAKRKLAPVALSSSVDVMFRKKNPVRRTVPTGDA